MSIFNTNSNTLSSDISSTNSSSFFSRKFFIFIVFCFVILIAYYYVYHSNLYLSSHSYRIISGVNDDQTGFYVINYPTEKRFFYYRNSYKPCNASGGCEVSTFKSRITFIDNVDQESFKVFEIGNHYARDKNNIYFGLGVDNPDGVYPYKTSPSVVTIPLTNINDVVNQIDGAHISINEDVYFFDKRIEGAKASSFVFIESTSTKYYPDYIQNGFIRSNNSIFKGSQQVKAYGGNGFCINEVAVKEWLLNRDKICGDDFECLQKRPTPVSTKDTPVEIDVDSFSRFINEVINNDSGYVTNQSNYAKDKNHVYYGLYDEAVNKNNFFELYIVEGADPNTFLVKDLWSGSDSQNNYNYGCKI